MRKSGESGLDAFVRGVLHGEDTSIGAKMLRAILTPMAWCHQIGLETYLLPYRTGLRPLHRLRRADGTAVPVVGIGNLSSGGTGKTPMAALVAQTLRARGVRVALLSRGHGGANEYKNGGKSVGVVSEGLDDGKILLSTDEAGDEPVLLAHLLPDVPVLVGKDRRVSGQEAVARFNPDVVVLDDALQFWQLHRDVDIALLDARRPFDNGFLLPRGLLREPPSHLAKARIVVLTRADRVSPTELEKATQRTRRYMRADAALFTATHAPIGWVSATDAAHEILPLDALRGKTAIVFSGIADNKTFQQTVEDLGVVVGCDVSFGDHARYDLPSIERFAQDQNEIAVTTEKDLVKIAPHWPRTANKPLYALRIAMQVKDAEAFAQTLVAFLELTESQAFRK